MEPEFSAGSKIEMEPEFSDGNEIEMEEPESHLVPVTTSNSTFSSELPPFYPGIVVENYIHNVTQ